jgi:carbonic anhydrase/acetyltransferase-like protein (isoleucine patch superfamily)
MSGILLPFKGVTPTIGRNVFIAPTAAVIGDVVIGENSSLWFGVTARGDVHEIRIGSNTNIQDGSVLHVTGGKYGCYVGSNVTIGHGAIIHACRLEDWSFIGMGAIILDGAVVEGQSMVAAGAVVTPGKRVPKGELWAGNPAKKIKDLTEQDLANFAFSAPHYAELSGEYLAESWAM